MRVGIIGGGFVAKFHIIALLRVRGWDVVGVTAKKGAEELAKLIRDAGLGAGKVFASITEMAQEVDVIAIFVPNFARLEVMREIAAAKKAGAPFVAVICEKPLARNVGEAQQMVALAAEAGLLTAYFENQIHMPSVAKSRAQLARAESAMGSYHLTRSAEEHGGPHEPWFWDPTQQGGGVLCDMGCHSIAVGWYMLTPRGKAPDFLVPVSVTAETLLLKWRGSSVREMCLKKDPPWVDERGEPLVDYLKTPAEDYASGLVQFRNPETGQIVVAQFTDAWMYDAPGLRLLMEAFAPGISYTVNSLLSPAGIFISDEAAGAAAAAGIVDAEGALEKSQASRGALVLQPNEADLYGYQEEWVDALAAFQAGKDALLSWGYGLKVTELVMAAYMAAEFGKRIDLADPEMMEHVRTYVPLIQQGKGHAVLGVSTACLGCG